MDVNTLSRRSGLSLVIATVAMLVAGCTIGDVGEAVRDDAEMRASASASASQGRDAPSPTRGTSGERGTSTSAAPSAPESAPAPVDGDLTGRTIYLDPGHAAVMPANNPQVTDGRGGTKPCQVSGTTANDGWPEHTFNWLMAMEIKDQLEALGATVQLSREDDSGVADCIDLRAEKENSSAADVVVSLHADGAGEGNRGFHVITVADPLPGNDAEGSAELAANIRDGFLAGGFTPSNYLGVDGIDHRSDLTGLNLSTKPKVLVEFGNMRDSTDIALLASEDGRTGMAQAVVRGIIATIGQ